MKKLITLFKCCAPMNNPDENKETAEMQKEKTNDEQNLLNPEILPHYKFEIDVHELKRSEDNKKTDDAETEDDIRHKENSLTDSQKEEFKNNFDKENEKLESQLLAKSFLDDPDRILVEEKYIREEEKEIITYSKRGLLKYFENLQNLTDFDLLYNQNNLVIKTRKIGSDLSSSFILGKTTYTLPISTFEKEISIEFISKFIYNTEERIKWDKTLKAFNMLYQNDTFYLVQVWIFSPVVFVSERDHIDKRVNFFDEGKFYNFCSAIPDGFYPEENKVVRIKIYLNFTMITKDEENYYFTTYTQTDFKMNVPQQILNITLPTGVLSWYKSLIEAIKSKIKVSSVETTPNIE